ncbi:hypothetical protein [Hymenobacter canadensis]|uniref:Uncharacterized protein n=1 Tax=Hymenobacter canadensis TaxID=2999067 RepID=A0ABY7LUU4_9BACT|nr:hypothetical protein [Hymenobacter canadensis]WBA44162.1 hypothetical protein O3303_19940 [Hymenobacter canadensis]
MSTASLPDAAECWNTRYASAQYAYGTAFNTYLRRQLLENQERGVVLREGTFHAGPARVVRLLAARP